MSAQRNSTGTPATMRNIFGIIMIIIYVGVGIMFFCGVFEGVVYTESWEWVRWVGGGIFTAYGIWRAYRQFKGIDPGYGNDPD